MSATDIPKGAIGTIVVVGAVVVARLVAVSGARVVVYAVPLHATKIRVRIKPRRTGWHPLV
ncbi:MAG TPA: hypothetical protein VM848_04670 [Acidimicrobiia bacterium]|nr:hypothetical protein [Acidimicrobiia bacterium]